MNWIFADDPVGTPEALHRQVTTDRAFSPSRKIRGATTVDLVWQLAGGIRAQG